MVLNRLMNLNRRLDVYRFIFFRFISHRAHEQRANNGPNQTGLARVILYLTIHGQAGFNKKAPNLGAFLIAGTRFELMTFGL